MQIIIPMSGFGERFRRAGYDLPKPLIEVDGKPIIAHVIDLFPGETDFLFICNEDHLAEPGFAMRETLRHYCPTGRIAGIAPHKLGPVHAVLQAISEVDPVRPCIVNYCDFACHWDYADFKAFVAETRCDGAIPAYRGFHPHSLGGTLYAYVLERGLWAADIQEKQPFTDDPMNEFASSGTYFFRSGRLMREAFEAIVARGHQIKGEYYASLAYKPLFERGAPVAIYELQHFMQWGTPDDLEDYDQWSDAFRAMAQHRRGRAHHLGAVLVPAAGLGSRFTAEGYNRPKPLIEVSGRAMLLQALDGLPQAERTRIVLRRDAPGTQRLEADMMDLAPGVELHWLDEATDGQARTCALGLEGLDEDAPLTIGACDNGALFDEARLQRLIDDPQTDVIVWGKRGYAAARRQPENFGWIDASENGLVRGVSVKVPLQAPAHDPIITGAFTFKRAGDYLAAAERLFGRNARVNGEFYVDSLINDALALGLTCRLFEIDHYLGWGTPNELRTFAYWQSCFHKWPGHPYRLAQDPFLPASARAALEMACRYRRPARPNTHVEPGAVRAVAR